MATESLNESIGEGLSNNFGKNQHEMFTSLKMSDDVGSFYE
jgi:hypothetical protein